MEKFNILCRYLFSIFFLLGLTLNGRSQANYKSDNNLEHVQLIAEDSLPAGFPELETQIYNDPMPGYNFISPLKYGAHYMIICDNLSTPVFYRNIPWGACDFKIQPNGLLTYFSNKDHCFYGLDPLFNVVDTFSCQGEYAFCTDMHELRVQENGHYFILGYDHQLVGMDTVVPGGHPNALVTGLIVQEMDANDQIVFQWRSWDHFKITDADYWGSLQDSVIDYVHGNSIEITSDTSILISSRNMKEITKIDRRTGEIIWRLNGKNNQFTFIDDTLQFYYQHSIRLMPDSNRISIFDNGLGREPQQFSSALVYEIDEENMTATLIQRLGRSPSILGKVMGHAQRHHNGRTTIGWGHVDTNYTIGYDYIPGITEFKADSSIALEISFPNNSYRAFKFNWKNQALTPSMDEVVFESTLIGDSASIVMHIKNNTEAPMIINRVLHYDDHFHCNPDHNVLVNENDSVAIKITYKPDGDEPDEDVFTFCVDTYEGGISQRIACQVRTIGIPETQGINANFEDTGLMEIFPNPAADRISIRYPFIETQRSIHIYDLVGRKIDEFVMAKGTEVRLINVSAYTSGVYLIVLRSDDQILGMEKFIVN